MRQFSSCFQCNGSCVASCSEIWQKGIFNHHDDVRLDAYIWRTLTLMHSWYKPTFLRHHSGCRSSGAKYRPQAISDQHVDSFVTLESYQSYMYYAAYISCYTLYTMFETGLQPVGFPVIDGFVFSQRKRPLTFQAQHYSKVDHTRSIAFETAHRTNHKGFELVNNKKHLMAPRLRNFR